MTDQNSLIHLQMQFTSSLLRAGRDWRQLAHSALTAYSVSAACAIPLIAIGRLGEGVRQVALAEHIGMESPSLVRLLDQLSHAGLVRREVDAEDRRANTLWLTEQGHAMSAKIEEELTRLRTKLFENVEEKDIAAALQIFRTIEAATAIDKNALPADLS